MNRNTLPIYILVTFILIFTAPLFPNKNHSNNPQLFHQEKTAASTFQKAIHELKQIHKNYQRLENEKNSSRITIQDKKKILKDKAKSIFTSMIDIDYIGQLALGRNWKKLKKGKKEKFLKDFRIIIESKFSTKDKKTGPSSKGKKKKQIESISKIQFVKNIQFFDRIFLKKKVEKMATIIPGDEIDTNLDFLMISKNNLFIIYDVYLDGDSLVNSYRNQFNRIIRKKGLNGLLRTLGKKAKSIEKKRSP